MNKHLWLLVPLLGLSACDILSSRPDTLGDLDNDRNLPVVQEERLFVTKEQALNALRTYLESAPKNDKARLRAIKRLAELEVESSIRSAATSTDEDSQQEEIADTQKIQSSIELYRTALRDYPNNPGNDRVLYQLAKSYEAIGNQDQAIAVLEQLIQDYPESQYFTDSQFRLGEVFFVKGDYTRAEEAYSEVKNGQFSSIFSTRATYKRGWSRFKSQSYWQAIEDFYDVLSAYEEEENISGEKLSPADQELFNDCLRAISLSFSYLGGVDAIKEYFAQEQGSQHQKYAYEALGDLYRRQERVHDAVDIYTAYIDQHKDSDQAPALMLKTIATWEDSRFSDKLIAARKEFETRYGLNSAYWKTHDLSQAPNIREAGKENIRQLAAYYHSEYQSNKNPSAYAQAKHWYQHYQDNYPSEKDGAQTFFLYGELLSENNEPQAAVEKYKTAVQLFDGAAEGAEAAYALVTTADTLAGAANGAEKSKWLALNVEYSRYFSEHYSADTRASDTLIHAAGELYKAGDFQQVINIANSTPQSASKDQRAQALLLAAHGYFKLEKYTEAEKYYTDTLALQTLSAQERADVEERLAASVYFQGERAKQANELDTASALFLKVRQVAPNTKVAATAEFDAAALFITQKKWAEAISVLTRFRKAYPDSPLQSKASGNLAIAYMNDQQTAQAAREFDQLARQSDDPQIRRDALWQAAQLYQKENLDTEAIDAYRGYISAFPTPLPVAMEARYELAALYAKRGDTRNQTDWLKQLVSTQKNAKDKGNARTRLLASKAAAQLADIHYAAFEKVQLRLPLEKNLRLKKKTMTDAVKAYSEAASFGVTDTICYSTYQIGQIYAQFSHALLKSERPSNLDADALEEYTILLEDRAFPFEEKAVKFFELNAARIKDGTYNDSINESLARLSELFPARYQRTEKTEVFIHVED